MSGFWQIVEQISRLDVSSLYEFSPLAIFFILFFATFITEDATCLVAGALAGQGKISFALALGACFGGIYVGDVGLYWIGRLFGKPIVKTKIFKRFVSEKRLKIASEWLEERGASAIFLSRFLSGLRLPTYLAAGFLRTSFPKFAFYFFIAVALWTPMLVGSAVIAQKFFSPQYLLLSILILFVMVRVVLNLSTWRKRRLFVGKMRRYRNWEFWSIKIFYFPVVLYVIWLAVKHRSLTVFTCANPAILAGGFIGESKHEIYEGLKDQDHNSEFFLKHKFLSKDQDVEERFTEVKNYIDENELVFPIVVKPDMGERGKDVFIARNIDELEARLAGIEEDYFLQEFAEGDEVGIFYYRYPKQERGKIFSITEKNFPVLVGDGESNLETLILKDTRAVCLAKSYFKQNEERLDSVPNRGEEVQIIDIGTHSRGAIFKEGDWLKTPKVEKKIDEISQGYKGFYFGRFDIRASSFEDIKNGENFKILEINGVTSESTNIYDKRYSLPQAYRILFDQWRIAYEIGEQNRSCGAKPVSLFNLIRLLFGFEIKLKENDSEATGEICA